MSNFIITIDGPAASGKSTAARLLAQKLGADFLDTGAMYRAVTYAAMKADTDLSDENKLIDVMESCEFDFIPENSSMKVFLDKRDITELIRDSQVTANSRYIASARKVREKLVQTQRQFAANRNAIVTEGRDQGTVAFPDANVKFFLIAQPAERAKRRLAELEAKGKAGSLEEIQKSIEKRDQSDMNRNVGPLKPAQDAIVIDTTNIDIEQVIEKLYSIVTERGYKTD